MLEFKLQALALSGLHFFAVFNQTILNALGVAFQSFQLVQLRAEFLLGIHGVTLGSVRFEQGHLVVQYRYFHLGKSRGCQQGNT